MLDFVVRASANSSHNGNRAPAPPLRAAKIAGSSTWRRTKNAMTAGIAPRRNKPRQPMAGIAHAETKAARSTPNCQPSAT